MKTDRFSDSIRRKLESIRPEFTEKDWTRMQSALHQATPPHPGPSVTGGGSMWAGQPWLLAAATVSTVVLVAVSAWQWREINTLRQAVEQLNGQPGTVQTAPAPTQPERVAATTPADALPQPGRTPASPSVTNADQSALRQRDTVYIVRRVPVPQLLPVEAGKERSVQRTEMPPEQRYATAPKKLISANESRPDENQNSNNNPTTNGDSSTSSIEKNDANLPAESLNKSVREGTKNRQLSSSQKRGTNPSRSSSAGNANLEKNQPDRQQPTSAYNPVTETSDPNFAKTTAPTTPQPGTALGQNALPAEAGRTTIAVEQLASLPMNADRNWQAQLIKRAKKIRVAQPAVPTVAVAQPTEKAPASQPVRVATRFRAGVGGELSGSVWSAGLFTEVLIGKHLALGIGLGKGTHSSSFIDDFDFESRTNRDFRREFPRGLDPKREILSIDTRVTRLQLPVNIGYRIPLSQSVTLIPSVGTNLNLNSVEHVAFYMPIYGPQRGYEKGTFSLSRSVDLLTNFQVAPGVEWQRGHWVAQGSPVFNVPVQAQSNSAQAIPGWPQTALGLRARLLYQF